MQTMTHILLFRIQNGIYEDSTQSQLARNRLFFADITKKRYKRHNAKNKEDLKLIREQKATDNQMQHDVAIDGAFCDGMVEEWAGNSGINGAIFVRGIVEEIGGIHPHITNMRQTTCQIRLSRLLQNPTNIDICEK